MSPTPVCRARCLCAAPSGLSRVPALASRPPAPTSPRDSSDRSAPSLDWPLPSPQVAITYLFICPFYPPLDERLMRASASPVFFRAVTPAPRTMAGESRCLVIPCRISVCPHHSGWVPCGPIHDVLCQRFANFCYRRVASSFYHIHVPLLPLFT